MNESGYPRDDSEGDIDVRRVMGILRSYRRVMGLLFAAAVAGTALTLLAAYLLLPTERLASMTVRLTFEGADQGAYPNGTPFSSADIVSTPVLAEVYASNQLERFVPFQNFKESIFVLPVNVDQGMLDREYQSKLADTKLTPVDRNKLEEEFHKKRDSLKTAEFSLNLRRSERLRQIPIDLVSKTMQDILSVWAQQATDRRGVLKYDVPVFSSRVIKKDLIDTEEYIVAADMLRAKILQVLENITLIGKLPGANVVRTPKDHASLAEISVGLEDLMKFKVEPLVGILRETGAARDSRNVYLYFQDRLLQIKLDREQSTRRLKSLQDGLRDYVFRGTQSQGGIASGRSGLGSEGTVIPQFGESFLDKLVDMSSQNSDAKFRQTLTNRIIDEGLLLADLDKQTAYYEALSQAVKSGAGSSKPQTLDADLRKRLTQAFDAVALALDGVGEIYLEISTRNLNPPSLLYRITVPFSTVTTSALPASRAVLYAITALLLSLVFIPAGCLVHGYTRGVGSNRQPAEVTGVPRPADKRSA